MNLNQIETQALVQRMFNHYLQAGLSSNEAISTLHQKLDTKYHQEIMSLANSQSSNGQNSVTSTANLFTDSLRKDIAELKGSTTNTDINSYDALRKIAPGVKFCARFFSATFVYPLIIVVMALMVYTFYKTFVLPQMETVFMGSGIPKFTSLLFSDVMALIILITAILITIFLILQITSLLTSFSNIKPKHSILGRLSGTSQHHCYLIFLSYLTVLIKSEPDASNADLVERASLYSSLEGLGLEYYKHHRVALKLVAEGSHQDLLNEVEFQLLDSMSSLEQAFINKQENLLLIFQVFIFIAVGSMITAMYLPIFKLASVF